MIQLKKFLVELPERLAFKDDEFLKKSIFKALYYSITSDGKFLSTLFDGVDTRLDIDPWVYLRKKEKAFYEHVIEEKYTHSTNQICGRVLQPREKVYRCTDCGYDDTCVLCSACFRIEDHEGHNVSAYITHGNGGMCDCGDKTAFVKPLNCSCPSENEELSTDFEWAIKVTIKTVLDYVLDVANSSINTLPFVHRNINGLGGLRLSTPQISDFGSLPSQVYGVEDKNTNDKWYLILWNDENHDYAEAETGIIAATGVDHQKAKDVANEINQKGRAILKEARDYADLLENQKAAQADGLVATISSARDFIRESIILHILSWMNEIISFRGNSTFREVSKLVLARMLLEPGFEFSKPLARSFFKSESLDVESACAINGIPLDGSFSVVHSPRVNDTALSHGFKKHSWYNINREPMTQLVNSRILCLLAFEVRFVSVFRKRFTRSLLPVLFADASTKATFCEQYMLAYPTLMSILAFSDREEELASSNEISVQLFTCPLTNKWIFDSQNFTNLLVPLCRLIEEEASEKNTEGFLNLKDVVIDIRSKREKAAVQNTIKTCIENVTRVITKNDDNNLLNHVLNSRNLQLFLSFLGFFQGLHPLKRKQGDHVERESLTDFYSFISKAVPISSIIGHSTRVVHVNDHQACDAIKKILDFLKFRGELSESQSCKIKKVSEDLVSPFHPINYFLSFVIQAAGLDSLKDILCDPENNFLSISKQSLRSIVLVSQVRIGLWIRNGTTVARQVCYLYDTLSDLTYARDLHLNQVAALVDQPEKTFRDFLDMWELTDWFSGNVTYDQTVYQQKFNFVCEKFLSFLYKILTNRLHFTKVQDPLMDAEYIKRAICYALCEEPKSFSMLKKLLPIHVSKSKKLDALLQECATYQSPSGVYDVGLYRLKPDLHEFLDPMGQPEEKSSQSIFEALHTNITKFKHCDIRKVILTPKFNMCDDLFVNSRIGSILRTKDFAKFVYKLLQVSIDTHDEEYLPQLLHLLHATIMDGELIHGRKHLEQNLVSIPISNLLLTIIESNMSPAIIAKAEFLLDIFITRNESVLISLTECFGEAHVESYKHEKREQSGFKRQKQAKLARHRNAKIMKQFERQREAFLSKNALFEELSYNTILGSTALVLRNCVYCGEVETTRMSMGIPSVTKLTSCFWKLSMQQEHLVEHAFSGYATPLPIDENNVYSKGYPRELRHDGDVCSSCGHGAHFECHERARTLQFLPNACPLCHNMYNDFIPSYMQKSTFFDVHLLHGDPLLSKQPRDSLSSEAARHRDLLLSVVHGDFLDDNGHPHEELIDHILSKFKISHQGNGEEYTGHNPSLTDEIELLLANTIQANEMAMRIDVSDSGSVCPVSVPSSLSFLIRSLFQCRVLLHEAHRLRNIKKPSSVGSLEQTDQIRLNDSVFKEILSLIFTSKESLQTLVRFGFVKMIAKISLSLCLEYGDFLLRAELSSMGKFTPRADEVSAAYCTRFLRLVGVDLESISPKYFHNFFLALEICMLPYLRQCAILTEILLCDENTDFLQNFTKGYGRDLVDVQGSNSSDLLCRLLNLPTLPDILGSLGNKDTLGFELNIFEGTVKAHCNGNSNNLDYPGVPRLITLPDEFSLTIIDPGRVSTSETVCLLCGDKVAAWERSNHRNGCSPSSLLFCPEENSVIAIIELSRNLFEVLFPGPYMTTHGEVKRGPLNEKATLSHLRYSNLNKLWINQELYGFATRTMYGDRMRPAEEDTNLTGGILDEDSFDEFEFWE